MESLTIEMPVVMMCTASECVYNIGSNCHARAITIGDTIHPSCDTFLAGSRHTRQTQVAGIGACKTVGCKFNNDLECVAEYVQVGMIKDEANCITFALR